MCCGTLTRISRQPMEQAKMDVGEAALAYTHTHTSRLMQPQPSRQDQILVLANFHFRHPIVQCLLRAIECCNLAKSSSDCWRFVFICVFVFVCVCVCVCVCVWACLRGRMYTRVCVSDVQNCESLQPTRSIDLSKWSQRNKRVTGESAVSTTGYFNFFLSWPHLVVTVTRTCRTEWVLIWGPVFD